MVLLAVSTLVLAACGAGDSDSDILSAGGWPGMHSDGHNSDTSTVTGSRDLSMAWSRPIGSPVATYATIAASGQLFVTTKSNGGCNLFSFQMDNGRKRFCAVLGPGAAASTPIVDGATNIYVGDDGGMNSFNEHGQLRWRTQLVGTPISAQFTGDGNVLSVSQLGEVDVFSRQTGDRIVPPFSLMPPPDYLADPNLPVAPDGQGLNECFAGTAGCPVANTPAIDPATGKFFITVWRTGAATASLVGLTYTRGDNPTITQNWSSDILPGGSASSPSLSHDGKTVYVTDNQGHLLAVDAASGKTKWSYDLGFTPLGSSSVSADGLIIPSGGKDAHLIALRDTGDKAEVAWERMDLVQLGVPAQAAGSTGYTVVRSGAGDNPDLAMLTFDTTSGATVDQDVLPDAKGFTVGTSIGPKGEVVTPTLIGELFVLK
ncbi:outer membrane protein assembly factor BamB family protein [Antrihabitans cavernicola]|uniref:PQQ-binding-like beta-propeller repeat protein n=1 Tax=Antrihabitans cavernicola TaxID=2495913 RepID=A0A5A7SE00_9NOCA|nr:PQQ-binding-like beta-propeller repeat protein [Spelaeibacter cavernicola]KAA0024380.1 PQQ-binding-like beta-propeller repeat protein [Spelaeibacter cavernicola]